MLFSNKLGTFANKVILICNVIHCLLLPFLAISRCFFIRAHVGDDILDLYGLLLSLLLLTRFVGSCLWWFRSWWRYHQVIVVSRIDFSIRVGIRSSLILFVWHLLFVASSSSMFSFPPLRPV